MVRIYCQRALFPTILHKFYPYVSPKTQASKSETGWDAKWDNSATASVGLHTGEVGLESFTWIFALRGVMSVGYQWDVTISHTIVKFSILSPIESIVSFFSHGYVWNYSEKLKTKHTPWSREMRYCKESRPWCWKLMRKKRIYKHNEKKLHYLSQQWNHSIFMFKRNAIQLFNTPALVFCKAAFWIGDGRVKKMSQGYGELEQLH